jgi:glycosyltransferase involved in cell wall biosynthesis
MLEYTKKARRTIHVDCTHLNRRMSGIERITTELFDSNSMQSFDVRPFTSWGGPIGMIVAQLVGLPLWAVLKPRDLFVFSGYPPSPLSVWARHRSVVYVHDTFLITRKSDLNFAGKYYLSPMFRIAVRYFRYFMTNSLHTAMKLRKYCHPSATIIPYRPKIRNVFGVEPADRAKREAIPAAINVIGLGTIEPRKNFMAAARICQTLATLLGCPVDLNIVGRVGWGGDARRLAATKGVILHGFLKDNQVRELLERADFFICTSFEEGLGLPLLEAQFAGLPVIAPDMPIFREVLGESGLFINMRSAEEDAAGLAKALQDTHWRARFVNASLENVERWNKISEEDRCRIMSFLGDL